MRHIKFNKCVSYISSRSAGGVERWINFGVLSAGLLPLILFTLCSTRAFAFDAAADSLSNRGGVFSLSGLNLRKDRLQEQLQKLPLSQPGVLNNRFGYHSKILPPCRAGEAVPERWVRMTLRRAFELEAVCLIPAFNPRTGVNRSYGFPRRFSVDLIHRKSGDVTRIADWAASDFPDPGMSPVIFQVPDSVKANDVQINVALGADDGRGEFFAFAEVLAFTKGPVRNCAPWLRTRLEASDQFDAQPYWHISYLNDQIHSLGQHLGAKPSQSDGFVLRLPPDQVTPENPLVIELELEKTERPQYMEMYTVRPETDVALPSYGFPASYCIEISEHPDFKDKKQFFSTQEDRVSFDSHLATVFFSGRKTRYIKLIITELSEIDSYQYLALAELAIRNHGDELVEINQIRISGLPEGVNVETSSLTDGFSNGREIIPEWEWAQQMACRHALEGELAEVQATIQQVELLRETWMKRAIGATILVLLFGIIFQYFLRRKSLARQRLRIMRDLHDDVGSHLGSINLTTDRLLKNQLDSEFAEDLADVALNSREATSSLREIFRFGNQQELTLPVLMDRMVESARRILPDAEVSLHTDLDHFSALLPPALARNLRLFGKEVLHNCAKHSSAEVFGIEVASQGREYHLTFYDDGIGFDPTCSAEGLGLESLKERAEDMNGSVKIMSSAEQGTTIQLTLPVLKKNRGFLKRGSAL